MKRILLISLAVVSLAGCDMTNSSNPTSPSNPTVFAYTAIGASDAIGYGSSNVCFPFAPTCPDGKGYVPDLGRQYAADHPSVTVDLLNMGIPGAVLGPTVMTLGNQLGLGIPADFIDGELPFIQTNGSLVTIFAGGNDARTIGSALQAGYGGSNTNSYILNQASQFGADFNTLMNGVKAKSPQARVVILNLPNLAGTPFAAGYSLADKQTLQTISVTFTAQINTFATKGATVIDLMCDPNMYNAANFSSDGFHPNDAGYTYMAGLIYNVVKNGAITTPQASCSQMKIF